MQENLILESDDKCLRLTDRRVIHEIEGRSASTYTSIPIHKISCISFSTKASPWLFALAVLFVIGGGVAFNQRLETGIALVQFGIALCFLIAYFMRRYGVIEVVSDSGDRIVFKTAGLSHAQVRKFAETASNQICPRP